MAIYGVVSLQIADVGSMALSPMATRAPNILGGLVSGPFQRKSRSE